MKNIPLNIFMLICFLGLSINQSKAQTDFAPVGTTWHHRGRGGVYVTKSEKDTTIMGQNCRKLHQTLYLPEPAPYPYYLFYRTTRDLFVYGNTDTVFLYNELFSRFTPLYIFNVTAGDTIKLPHIRPSDCAGLSVDTTKGSLSYIVDSVKDVNYDGEILKTVYSRVLKNSYYYFGWCKWGDSVNVFAQKIGSPNFGLLPHCLENCAYTTGEDICAYIDTMICYSDDFVSIKFRDTCLSSTWVKSAVKETDKSNVTLIKPYPNPAYNQIYWDASNVPFPSNLRIFNILGQLCMQEKATANQKAIINISNLLPGIYLLQIANNKNEPVGSFSFIKN